MGSGGGGRGPEAKRSTDDQRRATRGQKQGPQPQTDDSWLIQPGDPHLILLSKKRCGGRCGGREKKLKHPNPFNSVQDLLCIIQPYF